MLRGRSGASGGGDNSSCSRHHRLLLPLLRHLLLLLLRPQLPTAVCLRLLSQPLMGHGKGLLAAPHRRRLFSKQQRRFLASMGRHRPLLFMLS